MKVLLRITVLIIGAAALLAAGRSWAQANFATNSTIRFDIGLTTVKNNDINFGIVRAGTASTYTITTTGAVTATGSGAPLGGTKVAGSVTIKGSATQTVNISVTGYTAQGGVTPANATCSYNGGAAAACAIATGAAPTAAGKTLLLGVDAIVNGTQADGVTATPSFTVNVIYN